MIFGFVADRKIISAINLNTGSVFVATVPLFLYIVMQYFYWSQILFSVIFAIGIGKTIKELTSFFNFRLEINNYYSICLVLSWNELFNNYVLVRSCWISQI
jgi:hypothetical protein